MAISPPLPGWPLQLTREEFTTDFPNFTYFHTPHGYLPSPDNHGLLVFFNVIPTHDLSDLILYCNRKLVSLALKKR